MERIVLSTYCSLVSIIILVEHRIILAIKSRDLTLGLCRIVSALSARDILLRNAPSADYLNLLTCYLIIQHVPATCCNTLCTYYVIVVHVCTADVYSKV